MRELFVRTLSGIVFATVLLSCIIVSPYAFAVFSLIVLAIGVFELFRLSKFFVNVHFVIGEVFSLLAFSIVGLVALDVLPVFWLLFEIPIVMLPLIHALFSKSDSVASILLYDYVSFFFLVLPQALMLFAYREDVFGNLSGAMLLVLVFSTLWVNDIFAYLTGKLLGKHKLYARISPGKTIEGSVGGMVFTVVGMMLFCHYSGWLSIYEGMGMAVIAVVFGTLGDLCESMLKRQAGVKDSGKLIPGHGGVLDRFDSVMFSVPFIFVYLYLLLV